MTQQQKQKNIIKNGNTNIKLTNKMDTQTEN